MRKITILAIFVLVVGLIAGLLQNRDTVQAGHPAGPVAYWPLNDDTDGTPNDAAHANNGTIDDFGGSGATYTGSDIPSLPSNDFGLDFDGSDFVTVPHDASLDMTSAYTFSVWLFVDNASNHRPILFRGTTNANDIEVYVQDPSSDLVVVHNRGNSGIFDFVRFADPPIGSLFHLAVVYDGTDVNAYFDGAAAAPNQWFDAAGAAAKNAGNDAGMVHLPISAPSDTDKPWWLGKVDHTAFGGIHHFDGRMDEVQIYNRALTLAEIEQLAGISTLRIVATDGLSGFGSTDCDGVGVPTYDSIDDAEDAAGTDDTILVCAGTYNESVYVSTSGLTIIDEGSGTQPVLDGDTPSPFATGFAIGGVSDVTISGLKIQDFSGDGIYIGGSSTDNTIIGNTITDKDDDGVDIGSGGTGNTIVDNTITLNFDDGIYVGSNDNLIVNNTIEDNGGNGLSLTAVSGNSILGNTLKDNEWGVYGYYTDTLIADNEAKKNSLGGYYVGAGSNVFVANKGSGNGSGGVGDGFSVTGPVGPQGNLFVNNTAHKNKDFGFDDNSTDSGTEGTGSLYFGNICGGPHPSKTSGPFATWFDNDDGGSDPGGLCLDTEGGPGS